MMTVLQLKNVRSGVCFLETVLVFQPFFPNVFDSRLCTVPLPRQQIKVDKKWSSLGD